MWIYLNLLKPTTIRELWEDMTEALEGGVSPGVVREELEDNIEALAKQYYGLLGEDIQEASGEESAVFARIEELKTLSGMDAVAVLEWAISILRGAKTGDPTELIQWLKRQTEKYIEEERGEPDGVELARFCGDA